MQASTETSARKILFFGPADIAPITSKKLSIPDLIYHGLIQDASQEVWLNSLEKPVEGHDIYLIAVGDLYLPLIRKYLTSILKDYPQTKVNVLLVDELYHDVSMFRNSNIIVKHISAPADLSLSCMGRTNRDGAAFLDADTIFVNAEQMHVFQTMIAFLEDKGFKFIETPKKLNWHLSAPFNALKGEIRALNLKQSSGFAYDESMTTVPFVYKYNYEMAETAEAAASAKPLTRPSAFSLFQPSPLLIGPVIIVGALIATAIIYNCWPIALAAAAIMTIAYANGAFSEKIKAPHSF